MLGEQVVCGGQGDSDHQLAPSRVQEERGGVSLRGDAQGMPSSLYEGSVGVNCLHLEGLKTALF